VFFTTREIGLTWRHRSADGAAVIGDDARSTTSARK
jgi:hypothetical protein